jgi:hypothetical protein
MNIRLLKILRENFLYIKENNIVLNLKTKSVVYGGFYSPLEKMLSENTTYYSHGYFFSLFDIYKKRKEKRIRINNFKYYLNSNKK